MLRAICVLDCTGQNLSDPSKLGHVDLDINGQGGVLLQSRVSSLAPSSSARRVSLGGHALNGLLQWEHSASNRHKVHPVSTPSHLALQHTKKCLATGSCSRSAPAWNLSVIKITRTLAC